MQEIKTILVTPWTGPNQEIFTGKKTRVILNKDRLDYRLKFTQKVTIELTKDGETHDIKESENYCNEEGVIDKINIIGVSKYIETEYKKETGEPYNVNMIDIYTSSNTITLTTDSEEEKDNLYKEIYNWKYNIDGK